MKVEDLLSGVTPEEKRGIEYAINFIKDRKQLDRMSYLSKDDATLAIKFYTVYQMFMVKGETADKVEDILQKFLALRCSVGGFGMVKIVDMFKTDIEYNQPLIRE